MPENEQGVFVENGEIVVRVAHTIACSSKYQEGYANLIDALKKYGVTSDAFEFEREHLNKIINPMTRKRAETIANGIDTDDAVQYFKHKEIVATIWSILCLLVIPFVCVIIAASTNSLTSPSSDSTAFSINMSIWALIISIGIGWPISASLSFYYNVLKKKVAGDRSSRALMYIAMVIFISWIGAIVVYLNTDKLTHEEILSKVKVK